MGRGRPAIQEGAAQSRGVARFRSGRILSVRGGQVVVHRLNADAAGSGEAVEDEITCAWIPVRNPWTPPRMRVVRTCRHADAGALPDLLGCYRPNCSATVRRLTEPFAVRGSSSAKAMRSGISKSASRPRL